MPQSKSLTLTAALDQNLLPEFIEQEEARGIGPVLTRAFDAALKKSAAEIKPPRLAGRTSRSTSRGGSRGK